MGRKPALFWIFSCFVLIILACSLWSQDKVADMVGPGGRLSFSPESQNRAQNELIIRTAAHVDLFFHVLAYLNIGEDASSYYSPDYIRRIRQEKAKLSTVDNHLEENLLTAAKIYLSDQNLRMINFLPFMCNSYKELWRGLRWLAEEENGESLNPYFPYFKQKYFKSAEAKKLLSILATYMKREYETFYQSYYEKKLEEFFQVKEQFFRYWQDKGQKLLGTLFKIYGRRPLIFLSFSLIKHGLGFSAPGFICAAVKFPESEEEIIYSFFWSIHEMTHQLVDETTQKSAGLEAVASTNVSDKLGYQVHLMKEKAVIYADYLLMRKLLPELLREYLIFFLSLYEQKDPADYFLFSINEIEDKFKTTFNLPDPVFRALEELYLNWTKSETDSPPLGTGNHL